MAAIGIVAVAWLIPSANGSPGDPIKQSGPLVIVGAPALAWKDVSAGNTPALWSLVKKGAVGALTTRVYVDRSCAPESWLTLSAGFAASNGHPAGHCPAPPTPVGPGQQTGAGPVSVPDWERVRHQMLALQPPAYVGTLATTLEQHGQCVSATGPAAAMGAATENGVVTHYASGIGDLDLGACPVSFISLAHYDDASLMVILDQMPADATVVVAGMSDENRPTTLHTLVIAGPGVRHGVLTSEATRQQGLVATTDLTALVLSRVGTAAPVLRIGRQPTVRPAATGAAVSDVRDLTEALDVEHPFVPIFFALFLGGSLVLLAIGVVRWWWISRRSTVYPRLHHRRVRAWFALLGAMCACMPVATFIVGVYPWWRMTHPRTCLCVGIAIASTLLTAMAFLGPWRRARSGPMTFLVGATFVVIALDVLSGSRLQLLSVMGLQPVYGGRYYGMGNVGAAIWLTASLMTATMLADPLVREGRRRTATAVVVAMGLVTLVIDSAPWWGAKAGAMLAIVPAFSYLALRVAQARMRPRAVVAIALLTLLVAGAFGFLDYLRPVQKRTHIGTTVADVVDHGDLHSMANIVRLNWRMLTSSWLNASVLVLIIVMIVIMLVLLVRPRVVAGPLADVLERYPILGPGLVAIVLCWLLAFLSEDSGTGIPPTGLLVVAPILTLLAARTPAEGRAQTPPAVTTASVMKPASTPTNTPT